MPMAPVQSGISELCYCNALTLNGAILFPSYDSESDLVAKKAFHELQPDASLSGISYSDFRVGALHCQTKEVAAL
jgi:agmatine/peptidylarginine deiminase